MAETNDSSSEKSPDRKWREFYLPRRYIIVFLGFIGMVNMYSMRVAGSMTIVAMVNQTALEPHNKSFIRMNECPDVNYDSQPSTKNNYKGELFLWDAQTQGAVLGAYYYGYVSTQVLGGVLAESFGVKWVFGGGVLVTALISLMMPTLATFGALAFGALRLVQGLADGLTIPAINLAISTWSPKLERSRMSTIIFTGSSIGTVFGLQVAGSLCSTDLFGGWPSVYYFLASVTCVWFLFWCLLMYETPSIHPSISKDELTFIEQNKDEACKKKKSAAFWKEIFTSKYMWALIVAHVGHNFGFNILLMQLPTYLSTALHFDLKSNGFLSSLPFLLQAIGMYLASFAADYLRTGNKMSITIIRKIFQSIGVFAPAVCMIGITMAGCQTEIIVFLLSLAMFLNGSIASGYNVTHVDLCPDFAGTLYALTNAFSNTTGFLGPLFVGYFTNSGGTLANWSKVFYTTAAVYVFTGLVFLFFGSAELQTWGVIEKKQRNQDIEENAMSVLNVKHIHSEL